ncbi:DUF2510 domain-containing protein [Streptomyces sp. NPDC052051]|uniref:DUF2510 domain-containing protein n=1 Tax=Streptomyces sp. NPDC052051 TaxID=3154649 RepID=UPI00343F5E50
MSSAPPPGWYRDPSYPLTERWWDGAAWSDHRRQPQTPEQPLASPPPPERGNSRRTKVIALATAGVVLVAGVVVGAVVLGRGGGDDAHAASSPTPPPPAPTDTTDSPSPSPSGSGDPHVVVDQLNGVTYPVLKGWGLPKDPVDDTTVLTTDPETFDCPGDAGLCYHGLVYSRTGATGTSLENLVKDDIKDAADVAYGRNGMDARPYGDITSHQVVKSGQVAVAGRAGYFVRWRVNTTKGSGGYVESMAFASSTGSQAPVLVRFVFQAGPDGPPLADMDRITQGIRSVDGSGTGGGVGSSIGTGQ